jgi:hypothetical protein
MTTYEDLSRYSYTDSAVPMLNVGWLGADRTFPVGAVNAGVVPALVRLAADPANLMRGSHTCQFCHAESPMMIQAPGTHQGRAFLGNGEIHVPGSDGVIYAAPTLIVHYIGAHGYRPPDAFVQAVLAHTGENRAASGQGGGLS